ncbi:MAG: hypothetical protein N4J56_002983 [Chroococcidiopsis sp. SAG 2025]|nr:hypothetical protein [Chroococcidiopsis sp. SAG 2025]MDV2993329.1 hypothetical protein [Chroococcidiopsis sp. SAG 2025]
MKLVEDRSEVKSQKSKFKVSRLPTPVRAGLPKNFVLNRDSV